MSTKAKGKHKLTSKSRLFVRQIADSLVQQIVLDGLKQFTIEGIVEAKWKIAGISNLILRIGDKEGAKLFILEANKMDALLNSQNTRGEIWANLREALEDEDSDDSSKD